MNQFPTRVPALSPDLNVIRASFGANGEQYVASGFRLKSKELAKMVNQEWAKIPIKKWAMFLKFVQT